MREKFVSANEAKVTKKQHTSPCGDCPWRRDSIKGWLGDMTAQEWLQMAHGEGKADCHATMQANDEPWQCAGLAIYRANVCKSVRDPEAMRLPADRVKVFSFGEFVKHHDGDK